MAWQDVRPSMHVAEQVAPVVIRVRTCLAWRIRDKNINSTITTNSSLLSDASSIQVHDPGLPRLLHLQALTDLFLHSLGISALMNKLNTSGQRIHDLGPRLVRSSDAMKLYRPNGLDVPGLPGLSLGLHGENCCAVIERNRYAATAAEQSDLWQRNAGFYGDEGA